jgi:hypothetical protein
MQHYSWARDRSSRIVSVLVLTFCFGFAVAADARWKVPKTENGQPDFQGIWDYGTSTPFMRPSALGEQRTYTEQEAIEVERKARESNEKMDAPIDLSKNEPKVGGGVGQEADQGSFVRRHDVTRVNGEYRTSILVDPPNGQLPRRKEFTDFFSQVSARGLKSSDGPDTLDPATRCLDALPVPTILPFPWNMFLQIVQTKDHVVLYTEMIHAARIVRLGDTHNDPKLKFWMGDSIGHFEGNTLVIHTANFRPEQSYAFILPMSAEFELTERFTRVSADEIVYQFTAVDPQAFTAPFTGERTIKRALPADRMLEYACHEGNYAMQGILAGTRKQEMDAAKQPAGH